MAEADSPGLSFDFKFPKGPAIETYVGDITQADADMLVVPEGVSFNGLGYIARQMTALLPKFRKSREKLISEKKNKFAAWETYTSKLDGKPFKHVIHAIVEPCPDQNVEEWSNKMHLLYQRIFQEADRKVATVLAVPLLGTGRGGGRSKDAIEAAVISVVSFKQSNHYSKELKKLEAVARKKGLTVKETPEIEQDVFKALSQQLAYVFGEKKEHEQLRTVLAGFMRSCQSDTEHNLGNFLIETSLDEVISSIEKGETVDSLCLLNAASNKFVLEILLIAVSGEEICIQPFGEKEFLPTLSLGTIGAQNRYFSLELEKDHVFPDIPQTWSRSTNDTELVTLWAESAEFKDVEQSFLSSFRESQNPSVKQIKRVQSTTQWKCYDIIREQMAKRYPDRTRDLEKELWHGTSETAIHPICKDGFDRRHCGKNATRYGKGVYFSTASSYAAQDRFSVPGVDGFKYMFRARVLTGLYTKGGMGMNVPPWFDEENHVRFDSVVDNCDTPSIFVIFHDTKAYPEYLIKFQ